MAGRRASSDSFATGRLRIVLACSICGNRNYKTTKSSREGGTLNLKKFCSHCNQHTMHVEGK